MKKRRQLLTVLLAVTVICSVVIMSGCGTKNEKPKTQTSSSGKNQVNTIKETKLEGYKVNVKSNYVHQTDAYGFALNFEVDFDDITPSYEAYVCNNMSSIVDKKIQEENSKSFDEIKEKNPDISDEGLKEKWSSVYKSVFCMNVTYSAAKKADIEWAPYPTSDNASKFSSMEEYLKTGNMYLVLKEGGNITGFILFEFPVEKDENNSVTYKEAKVLEAVYFEKTDGEYQNVNIDYVKSRVDNILENK